MVWFSLLYFVVLFLFFVFCRQRSFLDVLRDSSEGTSFDDLVGYSCNEDGAGAGDGVKKAQDVEVGPDNDTAPERRVRCFVFADGRV